MNQNIFNIDRSTIGVVNAGNIRSLELAISQIRDQGQPELFNSIKTFTENVVSSNDLTSETKNEIVEQLSFLSSEVAAPKENRKTAIAKSILEGLTKTISTTASLITLWSTLEPLLKAGLGLK